MQEATVALVCPDCTTNWRAPLSDLPDPGGEFECPDCSRTGTMAEFFKTTRDLEVVRDFHR